ncbi:MAG: AAA family ATPase [Bifidobacteriaceae bacterium]|jgi:energy-coupling factor transporter ATP-binding protein EcfA2|nr:AAA family ATPase [Bifidobacteriaceae bacterium]
MIAKVVLGNFRRFKDAVVEFDKGLNILVGDNESGKSTLLEAINLGLTKRWNGRFFEQVLSHHFITSSVADAYVAKAKAKTRPRPPELLIELYLEDGRSTARLKGKNNSLGENTPGYRLRAALDPDFEDEYESFLSEPTEVKTVPTEYFRVDWTDFSGQPVSARAQLVKASLIDASRIRLQSGADHHLRQIIAGTLDTKSRAQLARSYRLHQEHFTEDAAIVAINKSLAARGDGITDKDFTFEIDTSGANGWESAVSPHLDRLPFHFSGSGEQNRLKILLALSRRVDESHVVLIEEPENHLSFSNLNNLIERISSQSDGRQVIIATHSSFVVNKLGLGQVRLLGDSGASPLTALPSDTQDYFRKLAGHDTLRLVLARRVVLVEGPSDELLFQRAYFDKHGKRPIEDGVDVISVRGLSAKRFLDLAIPLKRRVVVLADNDGDHAAKVDKRYADYAEHGFITIARSEDDAKSTLEPQMLSANGLAAVNKILGRKDASEAEALAYMTDHKTDVALRFHDTDQRVAWPPYIEEAINALDQ